MKGFKTPVKMHVLFLLRYDKLNTKKNLAPLAFRITINGERTTLKSTGLMIEPDDWQQDVQRCNSNTYANRIIMITRSKLERIHTYFEHNEIEITANGILAAYINPLVKHITLKELYCQYIEHCNKLVRAGELHPDTVEVYRYKWGNIEKYFKNTLAKDVTPVKCEDFTDWLKLDSGKQMEKSTIARHITVLRKLTAYGLRKGLLTENRLKDYQFGRGADKPVIFLPYEELNKIWVYPFKNEKLQKAADMFILQAYTGFDYKDIKHFGLANIKTIQGINFIEYHREKNDNPALLPLHDVVKALIHKYNFDWPVWELDDYNKILKFVGSEAGITIKLTSKIGRKSFTQNKLIADGYDVPEISVMAGHKKQDTTLRHYIANSPARVINVEVQRRKGI